VEIEADDLSGDRLSEKFNEAYMARYGKNSLTANTPKELATLRVVGIGRSVRASLPQDGDRAAEGSTPDHSERDVWIDREGPTKVPVFDMEAFRPGHVVSGPALIDAVDSTLWAPPGSTVTMTAGRTLLTSFN